MMIIDQLSNASFYFPLHERLAKALHYLQDNAASSLPPGKYEIAGTDVYASVQESMTKPLEQGFWEAHRKYIDIHYVLEGAERIGYKPVAHLGAGKYDEVKDLLLFEGEGGEGTFYTTFPGTFIIMMPQDAHMPGIAIDTPQPYKKMVIKIAVFP
ncbi:MAG: YhcH/YjgK/YiaL family protein [Acidobacteria bacterium]|jgi:YhcH/YjgK/YiaL family protein|nr:YhcH/YjgK/YiaL family protein [Acidobacteriota bacterium]